VQAGLRDGERQALPRMVTRAWLAAALCAGLASGAPPKTLSELLAQSPAQDWRSLDPENTLYMEIPQGRVVIELAAHFAPLSAANIRTLAKAGYFDGLAIIRAQDNYVVQWGDPDEKNPKSLGEANVSVVPLSGAAGEMAITVAWDISWYQYRVLPESAQPVRLAERGHELAELEPSFRTWNARVDPDGRVVPEIARL